MIEGYTDQRILSLMSDERLFVSGKSPTSAVTEHLRSGESDKKKTEKKKKTALRLRENGINMDDYFDVCPGMSGCVWQVKLGQESLSTPGVDNWIRMDRCG